MKRALAFTVSSLLGHTREAKGGFEELSLFEPVQAVTKRRNKLIAVRISETDWKALKELQELAGVDSISDLLRLALKSYYYIVHALAAGKKIYIEDFDETPTQTHSVVRVSAEDQS